MRVWVECTYTHRRALHIYRDIRLYRRMHIHMWVRKRMDVLVCDCMRACVCSRMYTHVCMHVRGCVRICKKHITSMCRCIYLCGCACGPLVHVCTGLYAIVHDLGGDADVSAYAGEE